VEVVQWFAGPCCRAHVGHRLQPSHQLRVDGGMDRGFGGLGGVSGCREESREPQVEEQTGVPLR